MKKLLGIVVLGLLLTSCSDLKVKKALENCADQKFSVAPTRSKSFDLRADLAKSGLYAIWSGRVSRSHQKIIEKKEQKTASLKKWDSENPMPEMYKISDLTDPNKPITDQLKHAEKIRNEYHAKMRKWEEDRKVVEAMTENVVRFEKRKKFNAEAKMLRMKNGLADKQFKDMNFKRKSEMPLYVHLYGKCESEYNKLPNQFLMKYQK